MDLKIVSCGNRTSLYSRSLPSGKPQRILSVIQCSTVRPKLLCTVHGRHSIRTCWKIPNRGEKDIFYRVVFFFLFSYRFWVSTQNRDLPVHQMTARNNSIRFHLHRYGIEFVRETGGINLLFVHVFECVAYAVLLSRYIFGSGISPHSSAAPDIVVMFYDLLSARQHCTQVSLFLLHCDERSPPSHHLKGTCSASAVVRIDLDKSTTYVYRLKYFFSFFLFQCIKSFESNYYTGPRQRTLMFWRQYVVQCGPTRWYTCIAEIWFGMDAENMKKAKWSKLNVHVVCHIDQVFKCLCMLGISIFRKIFNFFFFLPADSN